MNRLINSLVNEDSDSFYPDKTFADDMSNYLLPITDDADDVNARGYLRYAISSALFWSRPGRSNTDTADSLRASRQLQSQLSNIGEIILNATIKNTAYSEYNDATGAAHVSEGATIYADALIEALEKTS